MTAITGEAAAVHAAGRTDAGVHALAMRAHVDIAKPIAPFRLMEALNARRAAGAGGGAGLCEVVADDWHARFSCLGRAYEYRIVNRRAPLTREVGLAWQVPQPLDAEAMAAAAAVLVGRHDFTTFRSAHCQADSPPAHPRPARRGARRRAGDDPGGGALVPPSPGALDGGMPGAGRDGALVGRVTMAAALAAARPGGVWGSTRRRTGCISYALHIRAQDA